MVPYLIGLHMTIDSWRGNINAEGWRLSTQELKMSSRAIAEMEEEEKHASDGEVHDVVVAVSRLGDDIRALMKLMLTEKPVLRRVQCRKTSKAYYGFGNASGLAFGATIQISNEIWYEYGQCADCTDERSSSWKEFTNLVEFLERSVRRHELQGSEIFIFTDNSTSKAAF
jgi:hypothetical protein